MSRVTIARLDPDALECEAVEYLAEVVRSKPDGRQLGVGVAAAGKIIEWAEKRRSPERAFLQLFEGDPKKAFRWIAENQQRILSALAPTAQLESKENEDVQRNSSEQGREVEGDEHG